MLDAEDDARARRAHDRVRITRADAGCVVSPTLHGPVRQPGAARVTAAADGELFDGAEESIGLARGWVEDVNRGRHAVPLHEVPAPAPNGRVVRDRARRLGADGDLRDVRQARDLDRRSAGDRGRGERERRSGVRAPAPHLSGDEGTRVVQLDRQLIDGEVGDISAGSA